MTETRPVFQGIQTFTGDIHNINTIDHVFTISLKDKAFCLHIRLDFKVISHGRIYFDLMRYVIRGGLEVEVKTYTDHKGVQTIMVDTIKGTNAPLWRIDWETPK